jgi:hypothetical protein
MVTNAFSGRSEPPTEEELAGELGAAKAVWDRLLAVQAHECDLTGQEWNSYSHKAGWSLRLKRGARNIIYLSPGRGCFVASFALGDKAVRAARESKLPKSVVQVIESAKRYAEGTAVRLEVSRAQDIAAIKKLTAIKLGN